MYTSRSIPQVLDCQAGNAATFGSLEQVNTGPTSEEDRIVDVLSSYWYWRRTPVNKGLAIFCSLSPMLSRNRTLKEFPTVSPAPKSQYLAVRLVP